MTPQQEREYVEARWEDARFESAHEYGDDSKPLYWLFYIGEWLPISGYSTEDEIIHAAFRFTKERKEQIAEVETEIDLLCKVWPAYYPSDSATMERIVDVEKARLAELKRGLREVPRG